MKPEPYKIFDDADKAIAYLRGAVGYKKAQAKRRRRVQACIKRMGETYALHESRKIARTPQHSVLSVWLAWRITEIGAG